MLAIAAAPTMLALETKAVADGRRTRAAFATIGTAAVRMGRAFAQMGRVIAEASAQIAKAFQSLLTPVGHYWRDGKLRRDHGYFKRRAKAQRAAKKAERLGL